MSSPTPASADAAAGPSPLTIGLRFVKQYYQNLMTDPDQLKKFYQPDKSVLSQGSGSDPTESSTTLVDLDSDRWLAEGRPMRIELEHGAIDAQLSVSGGILLVVTGHVDFFKDKQLDERKAFVHTFFLGTTAPNVKRYYVHNDILRFVSKIEDIPLPGASEDVPAVEKTTSDVGVVTDSEPVKEEKKEEPEVVAVVETESPPPEVIETPAVANETETEAPGGGVEESKEVAVDEEDSSPEKVVVEAPKESEKEVTEPPAAKPEKTGKGKRGKGRPKSPPKKEDQVGAAANKPTPGSWASLVASGSGTTKPAAGVASPARTKPPAQEKASPAPSPEKKNGDANKKVEPAAAPPSKTEKQENGPSSSAGKKNSERPPRRDAECTLVIKNLPEHTKEAELLAIFEPFAKKTDSKVLSSTISMHKNIAFVDYDSVAPVMAAIEAHGKEPLKLNGRTLEVDQKAAEQRARRTSGGRGGYRSGSPSGGGGGNGRFGGGGRNYRRDGGRGRGGRDGGGRGGRGGR